MTLEEYYAKEKARKDSIRIADSIQHVTDSIAELERSYWKTTTDVDELTGDSIHFMTLESENTEFLKFPYDGGTKMYIVLRKHPQMGFDAYIRVNKGNMMYGGSDGKTIKVKFDEGNVQSFICSNSKALNLDMLFIRNKSSFLKQLLNSKTCKIQAEFSQEGFIVFDFNTQNLMWKY